MLIIFNEHSTVADCLTDVKAALITALRDDLGADCDVDQAVDTTVDELANYVQNFRTMPELHAGVMNQIDDLVMDYPEIMDSLASRLQQVVPCLLSVILSGGATTTVWQLN